MMSVVSSPEDLQPEIKTKVLVLAAGMNGQALNPESLTMICTALKCEFAVRVSQQVAEEVIRQAQSPEKITAQVREAARVFAVELDKRYAVVRGTPFWSTKPGLEMLRRYLAQEYGVLQPNTKIAVMLRRLVPLPGMDRKDREDSSTVKVRPTMRYPACVAHG